MGKKYNTKHYNLQTIIAVGFKINNQRAVQFRKWANNIVKEYTLAAARLNRVAGKVEKFFFRYCVDLMALSH